MTQRSPELSKYSPAPNSNGYVLDMTSIMEGFEFGRNYQIRVPMGTIQSEFTEMLVQALVETEVIEAAEAAFVFPALGVLQHRNDELDLARFNRRLTAHIDEFGAEGVVAVDGLEHALGFGTGDQDVVETLATAMTASEGPPVFLTGNGRFPSFDKANLEQLTVAQAIVSYLPAQYELQTSGIVLPEVVHMRTKTQSFVTPTGENRLGFTAAERQSRS